LGGLVERIGAALAASPPPDLAVVEGENYYDAARRAVDALGGMSRFVSKNSTIGLLVNSPFDRPGTFAKPQIALAVIAMCYEAGASQIVSLEGASRSYWRRATLSKEHEEQVASVRGPGESRSVDLRSGVKLRKAEIVREFLDCDVLINIPIFKDHEGTRFTGVLKNIMGATAGSTNRYFHKGSGAGGYYRDIDFLSQCIADAHLMRKPTLCVGDGTETIVTNGPAGPGRMIKPRKVVAGTDLVAVDAFGATLIGLHPEEIAMIRMAQDHGLGSARLDTLAIANITL
jgi:uncharacterized protein (DUF362 family)